MRQTAIWILFISLMFLSCAKDATKYRDLLGGSEITYPGLTNNFKAYQGNLRLKLQWNPSPDPGIKRYIIYWNNGNDSILLKSSGNNPADTVSTIISGLNEDIQNFVLYTIGEKGERSIGQTLSAVRIYGPLYISSLVNRSLNAGKAPVAINSNTYKLFFTVADTLNISTSLTYLDSLQQTRIVNISAKTDSVILNLATAGTKVAVRSSYVPIRNAIDTFEVTYSDTLTLK